MKRALANLTAAFALCASMPALAAEDDAGATLKVCLNKDNAPFSFKKEGVAGGYDYLVAQSVARQLGKTLDVKWYDKERRSRGPVSVKTSVLINAGVCQLVGGYPLIQTSLDRPSGEATTLPPVEGMAPEDRKQSIPGSQLIAGGPYHFAGITVVLSASIPLKKLVSLDDLQPYKIGNRPASMGDLIAMSYKKGQLMRNIIHVGMQADPLESLSKAEFDVTLIESHKFDMHRQDNPQTTLRASGFYLPVGFNLGFVTTEEHAELLTAVNGVVGQMEKNGELDKLARSAGLTYIAPLSPAVRTGLGLQQITQ